MKFSKIYYLSLIYFLFFNLVLSCQVQALEFEKPNIEDSDFQAEYYNQSVPDPIIMEAGSTKEIIIRFKNIGQENWSASSDNYVSVYTINPKYRASQFLGSDWIANNNPTRLTKDTKVDAIGEFKIILKAPSKVGEYKEDFYLAAENITWIDGGYFYLKIKVTEPVKTTAVSNASSSYLFTKYLEIGDEGEEVKQLQLKLKELGYFSNQQITGYFGEITKQAVIAFQKNKNLSPFPGYVGPSTRIELNRTKVTSVANTKSTTTTTVAISQPTVSAVSTSTGYLAKLGFVTKKSVTAIGGQKINFIVVFNNSGEKNWDKIEWRLEAVFDAQGKTTNEAILGNESWLTDKKLFQSSDIIKSKNDLLLPFSFNTPAKVGKYTVKFRLSNNNKFIPGGELILPLEVTKDASADYTPVVLQADSQSRVLIEEPNIRVGLYSSNGEVQFVSDYDYLVYSSTTYQGLLPAKTAVKLTYLNGTYYFKSTAKEFNSQEYIKLIPQSADAFFTLTNYTRTVDYRPNQNYNSYRGSLIYKYSKTKAAPYIINELPLDDYIAGIAETDNLSNIEYIKSVLIAARSYAYFNIVNGLPADQKSFDVYASTVDQLYLGYNSEISMPNVKKAAQDTYGQMVTFNKEPVTTPYFGHSDGKTRGWKEIWGGTDKPWLKPVEAKYDQGLSMYGHGVGMSNRDASFRAVKDNWNYEQILKYYYTDIEVEQIY